MQGFYNPNMGMPQPNSFGMNAQQPQMATDPKSYCQTLTVEQANLLRKQVEEFTLTISEKEKLAAICMHRDPSTGKSTLSANGSNDGEVTCLLCGKSFHIVDNIKEEDIITAVKNLLDVLQTTKTMYLDMPVESAKHFYPILALIEKIPGLYKIASNNLKQHEQAINASFNQSNTSFSGMYNMISSPWGTNPYMFQQPMMQPQPYAPMGAPQMAPGGNPFFTAPQPNMNPMGSAYQPQTAQYAYTPNNMTAAATVANGAAQPTAPDPAAAPQAAPAQATTDGSNVSVNQSFTV